MDALFGDASTIMGTPSVRDETGSLIRGGSPIGSARAGGAGDGIGPSFGTTLGEAFAKSNSQGNSRGDGTIGGWLSRITGRNQSDGDGSGQGRYAPLGQQEEGNRRDN